ncbi:MAG: alpha/beta fold hydrolase [Actinomycetota bacterium]
MAEEERWLQVPVGNRTIEALVLGPPGAMPLVFHNGTPSAAIVHRPLADAAAREGLSFVTTSRPGYAGSTAQPGRTVADVAGDTGALLDALGATGFVTLGWSGGGPHALACAALLPGRCRAAATIGGVAPFDSGFDWLAGMSPENVYEFGEAIGGEQRITAFLDTATAHLAGVQSEELAAALGGLISGPDRAAVTGDFAEYLAAMMRRSITTGAAGWRDDDLAFVKGWGFRLDAISVPVAIWQGDRDQMVPFRHGEWLAGAVPAARAHLLAGEGHLTLAVGRVGEIVHELAVLAGL